LVATDGAAGLPEHAPFDRIIATCAVPSIPLTWVRQTSPGGVILADLKPAPGAGSLIRLTRYPDRAEGRFDPTYAAFMDLRHQSADQLTDRPPSPERAPGEPERRTTTLDPRTPWTSLVAWFIATFTLGPGISIGYDRPDENWKPTVTSVATGDGSWAEVALADDHGTHQVLEAGPRRVWHLVEQAHSLWTALGQPGWDRFGLTVTDNSQHVWIDNPAGRHIWPLLIEHSP
ncbi:MAG TPA: protein-L-isoaspartate(D-aspartate) O-methyltransferase, partial [Pseudonocardiaceae bacterium]|nr:protein-L-isoaspartate(D-aspartate) O-methyltransferase [Pseudonocardiaceae bacterium]